MELVLGLATWVGQAVEYGRERHRRHGAPPGSILDRAASCPGDD
jgi:hypothetical protein